TDHLDQKDDLHNFTNQMDDTRQAVLIMVNHDQLPFAQTNPFFDKQPEKRPNRHDANPAELQYEHQHTEAENGIRAGDADWRQPGHAYRTDRRKEAIEKTYFHARKVYPRQIQ